MYRPPPSVPALQSLTVTFSMCAEAPALTPPAMPPDEQPSTAGTPRPSAVRSRQNTDVPQLDTPPPSLPVEQLCRSAPQSSTTRPV